MRVRGWGLGTWISIAAAAAFVLIWHQVLLGQRSLVGADLLYQAAPWFGSPGAHEGRNSIVSDPVQEFFPWLVTVRQELLAGRLPLWDPSALTGRPLLANHQSAVFSPFTWLALWFPPAIGMSVAMLAKLWVGGIGMAVFMRILGVGGAGAAIAGISYATSSFMVVWLGWPQSSVAALMPWMFAAFEAYLRRGHRTRWLVVLVVVWALQLLAGHGETSLQFGAAFGLYALVRCLAIGDSGWRPLRDLILALVLGTAVAGIQLIPFVDNLKETTIFADRSTDRAVVARLEFREIRTWLIPNATGNPGIDTIWNGNRPNYNEATGFAGIGALFLAVFGVGWQWRREPSVVTALVTIGLVSFGIVYGPLHELAAYVPLLDLTATRRLLAVVCFAVTALAGLGADALLTQSRREEGATPARPVMVAGCSAVLGLVIMGLILRRIGIGIDRLLPTVSGLFGFWILVAVLSVLAAGSFVVTGTRLRRARWAVAGFGALVIVEGALFAGPFNPRVPLSEVPPHSSAVDWLKEHAGDRTIVGLNQALAPESATLFGLHDARGVDPLINPRLIEFWSKADPDLNPAWRMIILRRPGADWLAAAGVAYVVADREYTLPGTVAAFTADGVTIAAVPGSRPFAYIAPDTVLAEDMTHALALVDPRGPVVVERKADGGPLAAGRSSGQHVTVRSRRGGEIDLDVESDVEATVVILQSFSSGWRVWIDGRPTAVYPANVLFQAVRVPSGSHAVALRYRPVSLVRGAFVTGAGVLGLVWWAVYRRRPVSLSDPGNFAARDH